jgi:hypothetical protein
MFKFYIITDRRGRVRGWGLAKEVDMEGLPDKYEGLDVTEARPE